MSAPDTRARGDYSRGNSPSRGAGNGSAEPFSGLPPLVFYVLAAAAALGALLLVIADFTTLYRIQVGATAVTTVSGHSQHSFAMVLLGLAALPMVFGALRGALPAKLALVLIGVAAVIAGPVADRHDVSSTGLIGDAYAGASAHAGAGFRMEIVGAVLVLAAGGAMALGTVWGRASGASGAERGRGRGAGARRRPGGGESAEAGDADGGATPRTRETSLPENPYADA